MLRIQKSFGIKLVFAKFLREVDTLEERLSVSVFQIFFAAHAADPMTPDRLSTGA